MNSTSAADVINNTNLAAGVRNRFQLQAFNYVGTGNVAGTASVPADPSLTDQNTQQVGV